LAGCARILIPDEVVIQSFVSNSDLGNPDCLMMLDSVPILSAL